MHSRCSNPKDRYYPQYGGRGIKVCAAWASFEVFALSMGPRPVGMTLDRRDNDKDYSPENCRWATAREQTLNRSITRWLELDGRTQCLSDWAKEFGHSHQKVLWRLKNGWSVREAITKP